ncbi:MAG: flagellar basal body-associated FliL family protein [Rhodobacteraceae bacterium]|nr:flagellar basal body-associated FliL family protein [Paracoccaceae bacterium]
MAKLLPVLIVLFGVLGGFGAGMLLRPAPESTDAAEAFEDGEAISAWGGMDGATGRAETEIIRMSDHFAVPVLEGGSVRALMVVNLSLELAGVEGELVAAREPRLRDRFLQVMFDHANAGGFAGVFTANDALTTLRTALTEAAREVLGPGVAEVLITDIYRRDV